MQAEHRGSNPHSPSGGGGSHPVCRSCGWTFPNQHPSAKQRRAHRKHCGKIEGCFTLVSPHAGEDGGGNVNGGHDGAVAPAAALGVGISDALPHSPMESTRSLAALETPAMEGWSVDTRPGTGEGMRTSGSVGCHGGEALVAIYSANAEDPSEATSAPGDDKDFKVLDLLHDKEIEEVDVVNVMAQSENGKHLQDPPTYTSHIKMDRSAVEFTNARGGTSLPTTTSPDCLVNEMCAEVDRGVLDEFSVEMKAIADDRCKEGSNTYWEPLPINASAGNNFMDAELESLSRDSFVEINILSNLTISDGMKTSVPEIAKTKNLKEICLGSFHIQKTENNGVVENELGSAPVLMNITADCQDISADPDENGQQNNVLDRNMKEKKGYHDLSACQMPQNVFVDNIFGTNLGVGLCNEQVALLKPVLEPEDSIGYSDLRYVQPENISLESGKEYVSRTIHNVCKYQGQAETVLSDNMLNESRKEDFSRINHSVCNYQGIEEPNNNISLETVITAAELFSDCTMDPGVEEMQSESASVEPSEICLGFLSSGQTYLNNFESKEKVNKDIANSSDKNVNGTDGINEVELWTGAKGESHLSIENIKGTEHSASGELIAFQISMEDQSLKNLVSVVEGPVLSLDHVEENTECSYGKKASFPDMECHLRSEVETVEDGSTCGASYLFTQADEGKADSCIAVNSDSETNQDAARFNTKACRETINSESEADITDVKSLHYQDLGDNKMQGNREMTECRAATDVGSQPCVHGFSHIEAWLDDGLFVDSNQEEVEHGQSIVQGATDARSCITERNHLSDLELHKDEVEKESQLICASPMSGLCKSITDDISKNTGSMSHMSSPNLQNESNQSEVHGSSTEYINNINHGIVVAETSIPIEPSEAQNTASEKLDQEGKVNQNNEMRLSQESKNIPATDHMVSPPDMLSGIGSSDIAPLNIYREIASSVCLKSKEKTSIKVDKDEVRCQKVKETTNPECTSHISVESLHYQDLQENEVQRNVTTIVAVSSETNQPYPPIDIGSEGHGSIHLEAWIDHSSCADSDQTEVEGGQTIMHVETEPAIEEHHPTVDLGMKELDEDPELTCLSSTSDRSRLKMSDSFNILENMSTTSHQTEVEGGQTIMHVETEPAIEEHHSTVDLGMKELDEDPELTCLSSTSDRSRLKMSDSFNILENMSTTSNLNFQVICQKEIHECSRESAGDGDHVNVIRETHCQTKTSDTHTTLSERPGDEKRLDWNNGELLSQPYAEIPTRGNMISPSNMLSGRHSLIPLEELNRREIASSICHNSDKCEDNPTLNEEDPIASSAQDSLMDIISQTDSVEVHWGSVSVLSASEAVDSLQGLEAEALQDVNTARPGGVDASGFMNRAVSEEQCTEIANLSEAPSLALTGESEVSVEGTANDTSPHKQATYESKERKKKEEIIAKVESWSSCKQHTPLKTLLAEANNESWQKTPILKLPMHSNRSQAPPNEGIRTGIPVPVSEHLSDSCVEKAAQKEWNSPARLPTSKNEKRKSKGKPQWVPFLCCPSLN